MWEPHTLAVVATASGFEAHRTINLPVKIQRILRSLNGYERRHRRTHTLEEFTHDQFVLGVHQRMRPRLNINPLRYEGCQVFGGHVLMVEGDHAGTTSGAAEVVKVGVVA